MTVDKEIINEIRLSLLNLHDLYVKNKGDEYMSNKWRCIIESMLAADNVSKLRSWAEKAEISPQKNIGIEEDVLLPLVMENLRQDILTLNDDELWRVGIQIKELNATGFKKIPSRSLEYLLSDTSHRNNGKDFMATTIYNGYGTYTAVGACAEELSARYGWRKNQLRLADDSIVCWINIGEMGLEVIRQDFPSVLLLDSPVDTRDLQMQSNVDSLSRGQQALDYLRHIMVTEEVIVNGLNLRFLQPLDKVYFHVHKINHLVFSKKRIEGILENGQPLTLYGGGQWCDGQSMSGLFRQIDTYVRHHKTHLVGLFENYPDIVRERKERSDGILADNNIVKDKHQERIVCHLLNDQYICFGDDAVVVAASCPCVPLWQIQTTSGRQVPMVIANSKNITILTEREQKLYKTAWKEPYTLSDLAITPSPLNEGVRSGNSFEGSSMYRTMNGCFMARVYYDRTFLFNKLIPSDVARIYFYIEHPHEKKAFLNTIMSKIYKSNLNVLANI